MHVCPSERRAGATYCQAKRRSMTGAPTTLPFSDSGHNILFRSDDVLTSIGTVAGPVVPAYRWFERER
jgi:hypothetical protein